MTNYLILKLLDSQSIYLPTTHVYKNVELRSYSADNDYEIKVLMESAEQEHLDFSKYQYSARIATIVKSENDFDALNLSEDRFSEVLDMKYREAPLSNYKLSPIGYIKNLDSGKITPLQNEELKPSISFFTNRGDIQPFDSTNFILNTNTELTERYRRSLHWSRNSRNETNKQLKILFNWFALEALLKESEIDNINGIIRWFLGFPNGKKRNELSQNLLRQLSSHKSYTQWNKSLPQFIDNIRKFRNESVHSGFRSGDFTSEELKFYSQITQFCTAQCQDAVLSAILNNIETVPEFKSYLTCIFEETCNVNHIHGTIIHRLDNCVVNSLVK
ncbi:hypothetical protein SOPP22_12170 [Shewanella sp. OPT22]|nr:hypothetical protein SOPP22_12170 [Shewanella sp. OPT22]